MHRMISRRSYHKSSLKEISGRMKNYEQKMDLQVSPNQYYMIRLDGHAFSQYCRGLAKPYDYRIHLAMIHTAADLLHKFNSRSAFSFSDEISLVFAPTDSSPWYNNENNTKTMFYNGRMAKWCSLTASMASSRFNYYMNKQKFDPLVDIKSLHRIRNHQAIFDSRLFCLPSATELVDNIFWRAQDCSRNSKISFAQCHLTRESLHGLSASDAIQLVKDKKDIDYWHDTPDWFRYGTLIKKIQIDHQGVNKKTEEVVNVKRSRLAFGNINFASDVIVDAEEILLGKYAPDIINLQLLKSIKIK